jgi:16S rRNA (cytosine967-C5)-methyltransferase
MNPSSLAGHAVELVDKVARTNSPADRIVSDFCRQKKYLGSHDRRWITDKVYGIIRNFILLTEVGKSCGPGPKALNEFLLYEILIDGMSVEEIRAAYSQLLDSYKLAGTEIDLDSLSACSHRRMADLNEAHDVLILNSFPDFFCEALPSSVKDECTAIMTALNQGARVCIRVDTMKISRDVVVDSFRRDGIDATISRFSPFGVYLPKRINLNNSELYRSGRIEIQEEASQLVGLVVDPKKDEIIVDACSGAGGKSLEFASVSGGLAKIYALDIDRERLQNLRARMSRSGYGNIFPRLVSDENPRVEDLAGSADKVVVDAPCSGSGTLRRNPDKKFKLTRSYVEKRASYQKSLLKDYSRLVRIGGLLFYVTCSIFEEENQSVVRSFVNSNPNFQFVDVSGILSQPQFSDLIEEGFLAIYPHRCEMDGFFAAVMKRLS